MKVSAVLENIERIQQAFLVLSGLNLTLNNFDRAVNVQGGEEYDFIIVGAGSAGSIVANRLSEIDNVKVLLIEAGGNPPLESELPGLSAFLKSSAYDWNYTTTNNGYSSQCIQDNLTRYTRGKMLGGSSSINYMAYNRGNPYDYQKFAEAAQDPSWKWENILPYFKKIEKLTDKRLLNSPYRAYHGTTGNIKLTKYHSDSLNKFFESLKEIGENVLLDVTADEFLGFTEPLFNIGDGIRQSTANSYLQPAINRKNLDIVKNTLATKVIFDDNLQATGVEVIDEHDRKIVIKSKKEVILSAGAIGSPQLLMLSGIGPKHHLRSKHIPVLVDLPVGQAMQDHVTNLIFYRMEKSTHNIEPTNIREVSPIAMGFIALNKSQIQPDVQMIGHFGDYRNFLVNCAFIFSFQNHYCKNVYEEIEGHRVLLLTTHLFYEHSRGNILLQNKDPRQHPIIKTGYYSNTDDLDNHVRNVQHILLKLDETDYFRRIDAKLINPKLKQCINFEFNSKEYWECHILCSATTEHHMTSTCPMGSVVDARLRVYGVKNLRVVDASIMPLVPGANTNGPTMMIGEKASDMIKKDHNLY